MTALGIARDSAASIADSAMGGSTRAPIMTAYRQQALACASALSKGPQRARDVRARIPDAGRILLHNVYGWFDRAERGVYVLTEAGRAAAICGDVSAAVVRIRRCMVGLPYQF